MPEQKIQTHFVIVVDRDMEKFINIMSQAACEDPAYLHQIKAGKPLAQAAVRFYDAMIKGVQAVEWCNATGCNGGMCEHKT